MKSSYCRKSGNTGNPKFRDFKYFALTTQNIIPSPLSLANTDLIFEDYYIAARKKEKRIYSNEQVKQLPNIEKSHIHFAEWKSRKQSSQKLIRYLKNKRVPLKILEVGCGNGWLSHRLSQIEDSVVTGIDINKTEINQARLVFPDILNLKFISDKLDSVSHAEKFDIIVFAASIQYFFSLEETIEDVLLRLKIKGEIHILDTPFYTPADAEAARFRSQIYYRSLGLREMADYYFHHSSQSLKKFHFTWVYNPNDFKNKMLGRKTPFPWIRIQRS